MEVGHFFFPTIICTLFISINFMKLSLGVDTLVPNQTIYIGQTLISSNHEFEMGFFYPGKSPNTFLGLWYKSTPDVVVWVANRNNPVTDSQGVTFGITRNGALVICGGGSIIWSANSSSSAAAFSNPVLQLLDTGNLVVVDETMEDYLWQSFDYPTDTLIPGMKLVDDIDNGVEKYITSWRSYDDPSPGDFVLRIENKGLPELARYRGKMKTFRTGKFNGVSFSGILRIPNPVCRPDLVFNGERLISLSNPYDSSIMYRVNLDTSGSVHRYSLSVRRDKWNRVYTFPGDQCDEYGLCGPNGICRIDKPIRCECLKGFTPKFPREWDLQDWFGGCTRIVPLDCKNGEGFLEVRGVKYPDMLTFWVNTSMSLDECKSMCLENCSCTAYANTYITNGGSGCVLWFGDLIDTRELSGVDSTENIHVRLPVSELVDYSRNDLKKEKKERQTRLILISIASGVIVSGFINGGLFVMTRRKRQATKKSSNEDKELSLLEFATIVAATNNFSSENIIGKGGFGPVYKGILPTNEEIAVKRLSRTSGQGLEEFKNEVILIAKLQHKNLVRLLGCCVEGEERMLIYEYLQNKSLDYFVFDQNQRMLLTWPTRFNIIMGIVRGLLYLHQDSRLKIIHRDFKTSNILLDGNLNPKISDFGLARILEDDQHIARTKRVVGTFDYMAPEYAIDGKFSVKSDIFSLGVVLLEIISGEKNRGFTHSDHYNNLLGYAWLLWRENKILEVMDECLNNTFIESEVKKCILVGLLCVQKFDEDRPEMSSVLFMLGTDGVVLPEPREPGFFIERSCDPVRTSPIIRSDNGTITITDLEAR